MSGLSALVELVGSWSGRNQVLLPGEALHQSPTTAIITPVVRGKFVQLAYSWAYDGVPQEGMLIVGHEPVTDKISAVWMDSWHMGHTCMLCHAEASSAEVVAVRGSYAVEGGPDWGWRIVIEPTPESWNMRMYNIAPDDAEFLGVEATYTRV